MKDKIELYKISLINFINHYKDTHNADYIPSNIKLSNILIAIITLTIIGNLFKQHRKQSVHGYYIAYLILLLDKNMNIMCSIKLMDEHLVLLSSQISNIKSVNINCLAHDILFSRIKCLEIDQEYLKNVCQMAILFGWIFGGGVLNKEVINELNEAGTYLGEMIELSNTFDKNDFDNQFDKFVKSKQKFIEIMVKNDLFSETMRIIVNMFEDKID